MKEKTRHKVYYNRNEDELSQVMRSGVGYLVVSFLPLLERIRLRCVSTSFRDAVDDSLHVMEELQADRDLPLRDSARQWGALKWLTRKCATLKVLTVPPQVNIEQRLQDGRPPWPPRSIYDSCSWKARSDFNAGLESLVGACKQLRHVNLSGCYIRATDGGIRALVENCPQLRHLVVSLCHKMTDASLTMLAQRCPNLETLSFEDSVATDRGLCALAQGCSRLTTLAMAYCKNVTDEGLTAVAHGFPRLQSLSVSGGKITDRAIVAIARNCPDLRLLNVSHCSMVTDAAITAVGKCCPRLEVLDVSHSGSRRLGDQSLLVVAAHCPELKQLYAAGTCVTDALLATLRQSGVRLTALSFAEAKPYDIHHVPPQLIPGGRGRGQQRRGRGFVPNPPPPVFCQLIPLLKECPMLQHLDIGDSDVRFQHEDWEREGLCCPDLRYLDMGGFDCRQGEMVALARYCPELRTLILTENIHVNGQDIIAIATHCRMLHTLRLVGCEQVTDNSINFVVSRCSLLEELDVSGCPDISRNTVEDIEHKCKGLRTFHYCESVFEETYLSYEYGGDSRYSWVE